MVMSSERGEPTGAALALAVAGIAKAYTRKRRDGRPLPITSSLSEAPKRSDFPPADPGRAAAACADYNHD